ncbi:alpha/beta hydrolase [[Clostridium] hylemonae]|uniref:alpha/beta hydrolase n=1 Tax=[Clostridium] hylemonae TaxID=89153 RepID=UPI00110637CD|nr:alpha/beta hydrolase [[Clostridium] hylemonae]
MKNDFYYPSSDGRTNIHAVEWVPKQEIKAVVQICHGMVEYIERYDEFAAFLTERGIYVTGHDHLGHGKSAADEESLGYFDETNGNKYVIADIHRLRELTQEKYPDVPYIMLGHSMGSFLLRQYLTTYSRGLACAVIMGTGCQGSALLAMGRILCRIIALFKGWKHRSVLVNNLSFGSYNKRFEPGDTPKDWITSDKEKCAAYVSDPLCSFVFTVSAYYQMFAGMKVLTKKANTEKINKDLPLLLVSGADDPVGDFGKGVKKVYGQLREAGIRDVSMKLYDGDRHEILNETDREQVYEDIYRWISEKIAKEKGGNEK